MSKNKLKMEENSRVALNAGNDLIANSKNKLKIEDNPRMALNADNYLILIIGFVVILLGFILMSGGGSSSPEEFDYAMFSWRRITLAPILVIAGFAIEAYGIMKRTPRPKSNLPERK